MTEDTVLARTQDAKAGPTAPHQRGGGPRLLARAALAGMVLAGSGATANAAADFNLYDKPHPISEVRFEDGRGQVLNLAAFRGKVVLLNVWATWCPPCRWEMPTLDRLQARLGGPDFEVVPLSIDRGGRTAVRRFYREIGITNLGIYVDKTGKATRRLRVLGLPTTLLIDREGRALGRLFGPAEWDAPDIIALLRRTIAMSGDGDPRPGDSRVRQ